MIFLLKYWKAIAGLILAAALWGHGYYTRGLACTAAASLHEADDRKRDAEAARKLAEATQAVLDAERAHAAELERIAAQHEQDKRDAQAAYERDVADLRAGNVRLQNRWRGCVATGAVASGAAEPDAAARDREESAARIVRAAREADDWIRRLQDVIRSDRAGQGAEPVR